jgi:HAD superfamily hydrolase (TIGR01549 family)
MPLSHPIDEIRNKMEAQDAISQPHDTPPAFLFDLDGTLIDSVYLHVLAWHEALEKAGKRLSVWRIHRRVGMSGGLLVNALVRETGGAITREEAALLQKWHAEAFLKFMPQVRPLPGAVELLNCLAALGVPYAIATGGIREYADVSLRLLGLRPEVPVITRNEVRRAKPDPDVFLAAAARLGERTNDSIVVGDSVWDLLAARRARALGVGLLSGGYGQEELERAGAYRTYEDPLDLLNHLDEVGIRQNNQ